jgi:cell division protein YceG involved in septum cleavage
MVEEPTTVIPPPRPPRRHRAKASHGRIFLRRVVALAFVLGLLAILVGSAWAIFGGRGEEAAPPPKPVAPAPKTLRIIFPEGFTREQMATRVGEVNKIAEDRRNVEPRLSPTRYRALTAGSSRVPPQFLTEGRPPNLEGFLFPATYEFTAKTTTRQLVNKQLTAFRRNWSQLNLRAARAKNLTPYDVLIIASMVEKEVIAPEERALVATIRYGLNVPGTESLRESHLTDPTPYNTRIHPGLPPTPIANPGLASMQAAAHPAKANYLFFVRKPDKVHHFFTASEREFINYLNANGY